MLFVENSKKRMLLMFLREALLREWDPIGVCQSPEAYDEYDSYANDLLHMFCQGCTESDIVDYLFWAESEHMGLPGELAQIREVVAKLLLAIDGLITMRQ